MTKRIPHAQQPIRDAKAILRFMQKVESNDEGCWIWTGHKDKKGYGQIKIFRKAMWAHRASFAMFCGKIPFGMTIHHKCSNTSCVNPDHLEILSRSQNSKERWERK